MTSPLPAVLLACLLVVPSRASWDPFGTPAPPTGAPPGSSICIFSHSSGTQYIAANQVKTIVDSSKTVCETYHCDGNTGTAQLEFALSATCNSGCVDVAGSVTHCKCLSNCPSGGAPAGQNDVCAALQPCANGGTCSNTGDGQFSCACSVGFEGDRCQIDQCDGYCQNGGTCVHDPARSTGLRCDCPIGYMDDKCQTSACLFNPCHHGECVMDASSSTGYTCRCNPGYSGSLCQTLGTCEATWTQEGGYCYKAFDMKRTYDEAVSRCQDEGAIVSVSKSSAENDLIRGLIEGGMWIGLTDSVQEGSYVWSDGTPAFQNAGDFSHWKSGEPDNAHGTNTNADCVQASSTGKWLDIPCSNKKVFVCRKPA